MICVLFSRKVAPVRSSGLTPVPSSGATGQAPRLSSSWDPWLSLSRAAIPPSKEMYGGHGGRPLPNQYHFNNLSYLFTNGRPPVPPLSIFTSLLKPLTAAGPFPLSWSSTISLSFTPSMPPFELISSIARRTPWLMTLPYHAPEPVMARIAQTLYSFGSPAVISHVSKLFFDHMLLNPLAFL